MTVAGPGVSPFGTRHLIVSSPPVSERGQLVTAQESDLPAEIVTLPLVMPKKRPVIVSVSPAATAAGETASGSGRRIVKAALSVIADAPLTDGCTLTA